MAVIYKKQPFFLLVKTWDENTSLPETYKLQSNDSFNKVKAEVHQDSGKLGQTTFPRPWMVGSVSFSKDD